MEDETKSKAIELSDDSITIKEIKKNVRSHEGVLFSKSNLYVSKIFEYGDCGYDITEIYAYDDTDYCYCIFYFGTIDVYEGDYINFRGLPIANSNYQNVGGGVTLDTIFLGSIVEKK